MTPDPVSWAGSGHGLGTRLSSYIWHAVVHHSQGAYVTNSKFMRYYTSTMDEKQEVRLTCSAQSAPGV